MIALLDTSTGLCQLTLVDGVTIHEHQWQADRQLAHGLLEFVRQSLAEHDADFTTLTGLGVYRGPGSYTGLRIGMTVWNTLADARSLSIVGATGDDWQGQARQRLAAGKTDRIVLPEYGGEAHITTPRK